MPLRYICHSSHWSLVKINMSISQKKPSSQIGPFEKLGILVMKFLFLPFGTKVDRFVVEQLNF